MSKNYDNKVLYKSLSDIGFPKYRVGDNGTVWSICTGEWKMLKPRVTNKYGDSQVVLYPGYKAYSVPSLVLLSFVGTCPINHTACFKDHDRTNWQLRNLYWGLRKNHFDHRRKTSKYEKRKQKSNDVSTKVPRALKSGKLHHRLLVLEYGDVEIWKDVKGWEGFYQISNFGRIKSLSRTRPHMGGMYVIPEKIIKLNKGHKPKHTTLYNNGKIRTVTIHRLVMETFVGPCPEHMECCHDDGNVSNNRLDNLRWDTAVNNQSDRLRHGTDCRGEKNPNVVLTLKQVNKAKSLWNLGKYSMNQIANKLQLSGSAISNVLSGKSWNWC